MIDLKETLRVKDAIAANPDDYKNIIEKTELGICVTNDDGLYATVNDNYCKITGYSRPELIGNSFLMVVPETNRDELTELHDQFIDIQMELFEDFTIVGKDGNLIYIEVDAGFSDLIEGGKPHKITFISPIK